MIYSFICNEPRIGEKEMNGTYPSIYRKAKAAIFLLCVLFMMVNTCPVRSLLKSAFNPSVESTTSQKADRTDSFVYNDLRCSESSVTKAALLDFSNLGNNNLPLPLFLTVLSLYLSLSILSFVFSPFKSERGRLLTDGVPLFLKNRSIII